MRKALLWTSVAIICCIIATLYGTHLRPTHSHAAYALPRREPIRVWAAPSSLAPDPSGVNVNTAGLDELCAVKGIGPALAEKIIRERETNGRFCYPEDLLAVNGIGEKTLTKLISQLALD